MVYNTELAVHSENGTGDGSVLSVSSGNDDEGSYGLNRISFRENMDVTCEMRVLNGRSWNCLLQGAALGT